VLHSENVRREYVPAQFLAAAGTPDKGLKDDKEQHPRFSPWLTKRFIFNFKMLALIFEIIRLQAAFVKFSNLVYKPSFF
jgi:hypothetical protein